MTVGGGKAILYFVWSFGKLFEAKTMYVPLKWENSRWVVIECQGTDGRERECEVWYENNKDRVPTPKRKVGDAVVFRHNEHDVHTMKGDVRMIEWRYCDDWRPDNHGLMYTIYANGHVRWTKEENICGL